MIWLAIITIYYIIIIYRSHNDEKILTDISIHFFLICIKYIENIFNAYLL